MYFNIILVAVKLIIIAYLVKSFRQALCAMSLPVNDEKLLVVTSSLEAGVRAVQLGFYAQGITQIHNAHNCNKVF